MQLSQPVAPGGHACLFYEDLDQQREVVLPFIHEGLEEGEQCVYVADEMAVDDWCSQLQARGIDVGRERQTRRLIVCSGERWRGAEFKSLLNARRTWDMIEAALAKYDGIRFVVDAGWMLSPPVGVSNICHWEATINPLIEDCPGVRVLCQYSLNRHGAPAVHSALRTHPHVIIGGNCTSNPHYEAPRILAGEPFLNHSLAEPGTLEGMFMALSMQPVCV